MAALAMVAFTACNNDDNGVVVVVPTCTDGVRNGTETGVDCGGSCDPCEVEMPPMEGIDFSGTYAQVDHMGRPGINTVLSSADLKDTHNVTIPSEMGAAFQMPFLNQAVALHDAFGAAYETNILGLDATTLTTVLANDALDVAPGNPTAYFGADSMDNQVVLTGRTPQDDVIDVSLILLFGGMSGDRFNGQDDGNGGELPRLVSDGVGLTADVSTTFPYLGDPE